MTREVGGGNSNDNSHSSSAASAFGFNLNTVPRRPFSIISVLDFCRDDDHIDAVLFAQEEHRAHVDCFPDLVAIEDQVVSDVGKFAWNFRILKTFVSRNAEVLRIAILESVT